MLSLVSILLRTRIASARSVAALIALTASASPLAAVEISVTPFAGYRWGGVLTDIPRRVDIDLRASASFGVAIDFEVAAGRRLELRYSRQPTDFKATGLNLDERLLPVRVDKLHLGGMKIWPGDEIRPFLVVSAGTTSFRPRSPQVKGDTRLSFGFGGGTQLVLGSVAAIRLEARLFSILTSRGARAICLGDDCQLGYAGRNVMFQGELAAGLTLSF